jgi:hypothetical protein
MSRQQSNEASRRRRNSQASRDSGVELRLRPIACSQLSEAGGDGAVKARYPDG